MVTTRVVFMLTSFLALPAFLVFYIVSSKTEPTVSKMVKIFSKKEDIGFHSMEVPPVIPRQNLTNGELHHEQGQIKYKLISSRYLRTIQVRLDCFKQKAVWVEWSLQTFP